MRQLAPGHDADHLARVILPAVSFEETSLAPAVDARRWRAGERNTRLGRSALQGLGSFAIRRIPRGGPVLVREARHGNFPVNHSDTPNVARASNRCGLFALRDIEAGEELTEDYRFLPYFGQGIPVLPQIIYRATVEEYRALVAREGFSLRSQRPPEPLAGGVFRP